MVRKLTLTEGVEVLMAGSPSIIDMQICSVWHRPCERMFQLVALGGNGYGLLDECFAISLPK